jgi:hypothetical protein
MMIADFFTTSYGQSPLWLKNIISHKKHWSKLKIVRNPFGDNITTNEKAVGPIKFLF